MRVQVAYLGGSRQQAGRTSEELELPVGSCVADAERAVVALHPQLGPLVAKARWARNFEFAQPTTPLEHGDELALLPPVAGGAPRAWVTEAPLSIDAACDAVRHPGAGALVLFIGTVRDHARGKPVTRLDYEAYEPMATRSLERIVTQCEQAHAGTRVAIVHRIGLLTVGEAAVVIATSSPHRAESFAACRDALERLKVEVPIWKRELALDGETWVGWGGG